MLLEELFHLVPDPQKHDGADNRADNLSIPLGPERTVRAEKPQQPAADETAEQADDDVPNEAALVFDNEEAGEPSRDGPEEECKDNVHRFSTLWFLQI